MQTQSRQLDTYRTLVERWATGGLPNWAQEGAEASDVVQVTLLRALKHLDRLRDLPEDAFLSYLHRILKNVINDRMRTARRHPARVDLSDDLPDPSPSPLDAVLAKELDEIYQRLLGRLSLAQRAVVAHRIETGLTYAEVGETVGISAGAARMRVSRALRIIAEGLYEAGWCSGQNIG